jgi:hypothetical protein
MDSPAKLSNQGTQDEKKSQKKKKTKHTTTQYLLDATMVRVTQTLFYVHVLSIVA